MNQVDVQERIAIKPTPKWVVDSDWLLHRQSWATSNANSLHSEKQTHADNKTRFYRTIHRYDTAADIQKGSIVELDFDPTFETIEIHNFSIFRNSTEIDKLSSLKKKIIQKESRSTHFIYTGIWTLILIIDDVREGDIVHYSYSYKGFNPLYGDHLFDSFCLSNYVPTDRVFCRLVAPQVTIKNHNNTACALRSSLNKHVFDWRWDISQVPSAIPEINQPSWYDHFSWIQVSTFMDWNDAADWSRRLFEKPVKISPELQQQIELWQTSHQAKDNLILTVIRFVQDEIRYLSLGEGISSYQAADPNLTFSRRYGDCKDKTLLLCLVFERLGFTSFPVLVHTHWKTQIQHWLPSPYAFNHAIVKLEHKNQSYWIDPTHTSQGGGNLGLICSIDYGIGLVIGAENNSLQSIERKTPLTQTITTTTFDISKGTTSGLMFMETVFFGEDANYFRSYFSNIKLPQLNQNYLEFYNRHYKNVQKHSDVIIKDDFDKNILTTKESYLIEELGQYDKDDHLHHFHVNPLTLFSYLNIQIDLTRKTPQLLAYPVNITEEIHFILPKSLNVAGVDVSVQNAYIEYKSTWIKQDDLHCTVKYQFKTLQDHIPIHDLLVMRDAIETINKDIGISLTLDLQTSNANSSTYANKKFWFYVAFALFALFQYLRDATTR